MALKIGDILNYFKQPFPYMHKKWQVVVIPSICVFVVAFVFRPHRLVASQSPYTIIFFVTLFTAVSSAIVAYIFPLLFKKYYSPKKWTKGKFFSYPLFIVTILIPPLAYYIDLQYRQEGLISAYSSGVLLLIWYLIGYIVAFFPTFIIYHIVLYYYRAGGSHTKGEKTITITSKLKETLELNPEYFLYAEVQGNYVTIYYLDEDQNLMHKTLRTTLLHIIDALADYPQILRTQRAFLANASYVTAIGRKQQNHALKLRHTAVEVPISKSYFEATQKAINPQ